MSEDNQPRYTTARLRLENGTCRGYLDGWQYKLPDFSCEAETMEKVEEILSAKLDEWKDAT